ncbi:MAG: hypothetical protein IT233_10910 [Bacteroidia bacterium]|nr:hypothetical protein [Bacteroidia bacterium]
MIRSLRMALLKHPVIRALLFSFPFRLVLLNFKKNLVFLVIWSVLFGFITGHLGTRYGVPYLFLNPEYLEESGMLAYFIMGFACGGFIMAYNISSYVMNAFRFPFLATLRHPFWKYCLNNFILPTTFLAIYITRIVLFLHRDELIGWGDSLSAAGSFLTGAALFIGCSFLYFFRTNKDINKLFGIRHDKDIPVPSARKLKAFKEMGVRNPNLITESRDWYVETYMSGPFRWKLVRPVKHYKRSILRQVFHQNHKNAFLFVSIALVSLFVLGWLDQVPVLAIPAGSSILLLFTMLLMVIGAMYALFRGWANFVMVGLFLLFNFMFTLKWFNSTNEIYGLNYAQKAQYDNETLMRLGTDKESLETDRSNTLSILQSWKARVTGGDTSLKPLMVIFNTSGGGIRSTLWTTYLMQVADSLTKGKFTRHTTLIAGSSGGMIGAAYYRELVNLENKGNHIPRNHPVYYDNISKDLLNPVAFTIATNDWFLPIRSVVVNGEKKPKDRGYAFEEKLNENTSNILDVPLSYYKDAEAKAEIPMMVFSPVIINDGRKLLISAQGISYLTHVPDPEEMKWNKLPNSVEYSKLLSGQDPGNARMLSILRVNSSFPYIFPVAGLPTEPCVELMDAGLRDNYGTEITLKYLYTFREWIRQNTSGVLIVQVRDKKKMVAVTENKGKSLTQSLSKPLGSLYLNHFTVQDYNHEDLLMYMQDWFGSSLHVLDFELRNLEEDNISLSWHLTNREKEKVLGSLTMPENRKNMELLVRMLR